MNRLAVIVIALTGGAGLAHAGVEIGGIAGSHVFSHHDGLGVMSGPNAESQRNSALFGVRLGAYLGKHIGIEAEGGVIPTEARGLVFDVYDLAIRGSLVYQMSPMHGFVPFALVGAGILNVASTDNPLIIKKDSVFAPHVGLGLKYQAEHGWGVRADARLLFPPSSTGGVTGDVEILLGLYKEYGRAQNAAALVPAPVHEQDPDKDGVIGDADKCPDQPEDKDGYQDDDGCPDPDNDSDGIPDAQDKCPNQAEDKDNFQDQDGCPDPDNDSDGIPDAADKCPEKPETANGFQDEDGCPDAVPDTLTPYLGPVAGLDFKTNTADLTKPATAALDKLATLLAGDDLKSVKVEIDAYTDDAPLPKRGKFTDATALTQARADAVKAYLVGKGVSADRLTAKGMGATAPIVDPTGLKGRKLYEARAKNRRVEMKLVVNAPAPVTPPAGNTQATPPAPPAPPATPAPAPGTK